MAQNNHADEGGGGDCPEWLLNRGRHVSGGALVRGRAKVRGRMSYLRCRSVQVVILHTASQQVYVYICKLSKVNTKMADEDEYCDLAVYVQFLGLKYQVNTPTVTTIFLMCCL